MLYLTKIISNTGAHLSKCLGIDNAIITQAKRMYKGKNEIFVSGSHEICLSNECELDGFFFPEDRKPKYDDSGYGCADSITGFKTKVILFLFGRKECEDTWESSFCECLSGFATRVEDSETSIKVLSISDDIPSIIKRYFPHVKKQFQSGQPCTTLIKIELEFNTTIC